MITYNDGMHVYAMFLPNKSINYLIFSRARVVLTIVYTRERHSMRLKPGFHMSGISYVRILLFPDRSRFCRLMKTQNRKYPRSSGMVGDKSGESGAFLFSRRIADFCDGRRSVKIYENSSLFPRRSPPLSGEREGHVRAWERVGVPAGVSFGDVTKFRAKSISGKGTPGY